MEQLQQNDTEQRVLAKIRGLSWIFDTASSLAETQRSGEALLRLLQEETNNKTYKLNLFSAGNCVKASIFIPQI